MSLVISRVQHMGGFHIVHERKYAIEEFTDHKLYLCRAVVWDMICELDLQNILLGFLSVR